jgi:monoterpene epsilon-lactone hydrolase
MKIQATSPLAFVSLLGLGLFLYGCGGRPEESPTPGGALPRGHSLQARALAAFMDIRRRISPPSPDLDVAWERANVESMAGMFKPMDEIQSEPVEAAGVPAEWIVPKGVPVTGVVLYLHGGSFTSGSIVSHRTLAGNVAIASRTRALLIDYRLAPEHPFPAGLEDAAAAYEWLLSQGIDPGRVVVTGDSAGGNLALSLLVLLRDKGRPLPAAAVCLSPNPDLTYSGESWVSNARKDVMIREHKERQAVDVYLRGADPREPLASPSFADLRGLPPMLLQVGSYEVLRSDVEDFAEKARQAGVKVTLEVWPGMQHEWQFTAKVLPEGRAAIARIGAFVQAALR